jgi:hypothetical protein
MVSEPPLPTCDEDLERLAVRVSLTVMNAVPIGVSLRYVGPTGCAARLDDRRSRRAGRAGLLLHDADVEHLLALAAVAEDRDADAAELPRQLVGRGHVLSLASLGRLMVLRTPLSV